MYLTLDSSIIVAALRKEEEHHLQCKQLLEKVKDGAHIALQPYSTLVEVVAAIRRRTDSEELAERVKVNIQKIGTIYFQQLEASRADKAADIARETGVRGMDAIVVQIAREFDAALVSLDKEMIQKVASHVKIKGLSEF